MRLSMKLVVSLPVSIFREDDAFIAYTPALDLSTSGKSFKVVRKRFDEVVKIFFEELAEAGTLGEVLESYGWKKVKHEWQPPVLVAQESASIQVPLVN